MPSPYHDAIEASLRRQGLPSVDPRHVEAWMRCEHPTLDALSAAQFEAEVRVAVECIEADPTTSERLAESLGL